MSTPHGKKALSTLFSSTLFIGSLLSAVAAATTQPEQVFSARFESAGDVGKLRLEPLGQDVGAEVTDGKLKLHGLATATLDYRLSGSSYAVAISQNPGLVSWSFKLTQTPNAVLNLYLGCVTRDLPAWWNTGYRVSFTGGSQGSFKRFGYFTYEGVEPNADLLTLPSVANAGEEASYRITYDPVTSTWSFYGGPSAPGQDPAQENRLLGQVTDSVFTVEDLPVSLRGLSIFGFHNLSNESSIDDLTMTAVTRPNQPPIVTNNLFSDPVINTDDTGRKHYDFYPLFNDTDPDGDTIQLVEITGFRNGAASIAQYYFFTYTTDLIPPQETFKVLTSDGHGGLATQLVSFNMEPFFSAPVVVGESVSMPASGTVTLDLLANDSDVDGEELRIIDLNAEKGSVTITPDNKVIYTAPETGIVRDQITYRVTDGYFTSDFATADIYPTLKGIFRGQIKATASEGERIGQAKAILDGFGGASYSLSILGRKFTWNGSVLPGVPQTFSFELKDGTPLNVTFTVPLAYEDPVVFTDFTYNGASYGASMERIAEAVPKSWMAQYNVVLPGHFADEQLPQGDGFGRVTIARNGSVRVVGRLPDGKPFSANSIWETGDKFSFSTQPYGTGKFASGSISGELSFERSAVEPICSGSLTWKRPPGVGRLYPDGFQVSQEAVGGRYYQGVSRSILQELGAKPVLEIDRGESAGGVSLVAEVRGSSVYAGTEGEDFRLSVNPKTGLWSAQVVHPISGARLLAQGIIDTRDGIARGYYVGETNTGSIKLLPDPLRQTAP